MKLLYFLFILALTSCITQKKCNQKFPPSTTRDSIYIETVTQKPVYLPGDTIKIDVPINCPDQDFSVENTKLRQEIRILNRRLSSSTVIKPDTVFVPVEKIVTKIQEVKVPEPVKYIPQRFKTYRNICFLIFALVFGYAGWKLYKIFK